MNIEKNERLLNEAMREMEADRVFYPDANSTMRLSFGMVVGTHRKMLLSILILRRQKEFLTR